MDTPVFNIGIIGYGMSAKVFHIPLIVGVPKLKLHAIVQRTPNDDDDPRKHHPHVKVYRSTEQLVEDKEVDAVLVLTTPETHFELAKLALKSGKHVVVEKPFTPTYKEAKELIKIAKEEKKLLTVYQNRRWDTDFLTALHLIKSDTLGRVVEFETHFDRYRPEASGGWKVTPGPGRGVVYDLGSHLIDQVVCTFGLPKRITGFVGSQREHNPTGNEDSCTILLHYDGMMATVKAGVISLELAQLRFWIRGQEGSYKKFHLDGQEDELKAGRKPGDPDFGVESCDKYGILTHKEHGKIAAHPFPTLPPLTYRVFYEQFARALAGEGDVPISPEGPAEVIRLIELARQSSAEGRTLNV